MEDKSDISGKEGAQPGAKKKILYLITKGNWGGAQRYVFDLAINLPLDRFDVSVAFGEGEVLEKKLRAAGIQTIRIPSLKRDANLFLDFRTLVALIKLLRAERPEILHLNSSKVGFIGALAGRITLVPRIVFTGHGWAWNEERFFLAKIAIALMHWLTVLLSHRTIAVAERVRAEISRLPFLRDKILVVHNGIGEINFKSQSDARRILGAAIHEKFWIGTISELHKNKGLDFLIRAFAGVVEKNSGVALVIINDGEEKERLSALAAELGVKDKVHFLGFIPDAPTLLKAFNIFVLSSRTEAFPYVILEAGLAQVPIVASAVGGIPEAIRSGESGILVERGNIEELQKSLIFLLSDASKSAEFAVAARARMSEFFSLPRMVEKTIAVYNG